MMEISAKIRYISWYALSHEGPTFPHDVGWPQKNGQIGRFLLANFSLHLGFFANRALQEILLLWTTKHLVFGQVDAGNELLATNQPLCV
jgi:hypothetical protein